QLFQNQLDNMELRIKAALLTNTVKLVEKSEVLNGLMGEQIRHKLIFKNKSQQRIKCNIILAFPSADWHMLEPESNLIDNVYWRENVTIPGNGRYNEIIKVAFPKSLALQDYKCLIKLEPISIRLLNEK
ncbi:MAG: hypothetical protein JSV49_01895, partial [Thermoplasmata archaeon]